MKRTWRGRPRASSFILLPLAVALVMAAWVVLAPGAAQARLAYLHGGIEDCETCHVNAHTWWTPTNEHCYDCHPGFQVRDPELLCWTCHAPGQDMSAERSDAACTEPCHLFGGETSRHTVHARGTAACTSCHAVSASPRSPAGSVHHTVPAPRVSAVAPAHGLPGTQVVVTGGAFTGATLVSFGGAVAVFSVEDDARITAVVPRGAASGPVRVVTRGGIASAAEPFVVTRVSSLTLRAARLVVPRGRSIRLTGLLRPAGLSAAVVAVTLERRTGGVWRTIRTAACVVSPSGTYAWSYRALRRGSYRASASLAASPEATAASSPRVIVRVR